MHVMLWSSLQHPHTLKLNAQANYLSLKILLKFQTSNSNALFPLARSSAQQLNDLKRPLQAFPCLHPLQTHQEIKSHLRSYGFSEMLNN